MYQILIDRFATTKPKHCEKLLLALDSALLDEHLDGHESKVCLCSGTSTAVEASLVSWTKSATWRWLQFNSAGNTAAAGFWQLPGSRLHLVAKKWQELGVDGIVLSPIVDQAVVSFLSVFAGAAS